MAPTSPVQPGLRFGRLKVISFSRIHDRYRWWLCLCDCGKQTEVRSSRLVEGSTRSCGCLLDETRRARKVRATVPKVIRIPKTKPTLAERFWAKVKKGLPDECWLWNASVDKRGYGQISIGSTERGNYRMLKAHRVSWELANGEIAGIKNWVLHKCDTPACVNPSHLFLGDQFDNMQDAAKKRRVRSGFDHHSSKLTPEQVLEIRAMYVPHIFSQENIGKRFGVPRSTIQAIVNGTNRRYEKGGNKWQESAAL